METKLVALIGPESTGKTTLCKKLAQHFGTTWVPEYARTYTGEISPLALVHIAQEQLSNIEKALPNANNLLFCDTDLHNIVVWSQHAFGECEPWLVHAEERQHFDFYLLLKPDIPWADDGLRKLPHMRHPLYETYRRRLEEKRRPYASIEGQQKARLDACVRALTAFFPSASLTKREGKK